MNAYRHSLIIVITIYLQTKLFRVYKTSYDKKFEPSDERQTLYLATSSVTSLRSPLVKIKPTFPCITNITHIIINDANR